MSMVEIFGQLMTSSDAEDLISEDARSVIDALRSQVAELQNKNETLVEALKIASVMCSELQETEKLARETISQQTERNIALTEKIKELQAKPDEAAKQEQPVLHVTEEISLHYGLIEDEPLYRHPPNTAALIEQARAEEREACAEVCERLANAAYDFERPNAYQCAKAIRARKP